MANKRITDLNNASSLRGDEKFIVDQVTPSCISGQDTVQANLADIQKFILTDAPLISATGNMEIDGTAIFDSSVTIAGELNTLTNINTDSITVENNISTREGQILSGGRDIYEMFYSGDDKVGTLEQVTANGSSTAQSITAENVVYANGFHVMADNDSVGYLSAGQRLDEIFITAGAAVGTLQQVTNNGSTTTNSLSVANLSSAGQIIGGSLTNSAPKSGSFIGGGNDNTVSDMRSSIVGGSHNCICNGSTDSSIAGGLHNDLVGDQSFIGGGTVNNVCSVGSVIGAGTQNVTKGAYSSVLGGSNNTTLSANGSVVGGCSNCSESTNSSILGGENNLTRGTHSSVIGGNTNKVCGTYSHIGTGQENIIHAGVSNAIIGGECNQIGGGCALVGDACQSTIAAGTLNEIHAGENHFVTGKYNIVNSIVQGENTIVAGSCNYVDASDSAVFGKGNCLTPNFNNTFILGSNITAFISGATLVNNLCSYGFASANRFLSAGQPLESVFAGVGAGTLQQVTDNGSTTTNSISVHNLSAYGNIVGGSETNSARAFNSGVLAGRQSHALAVESAIGGGRLNSTQAAATCSFIGAGTCNMLHGTNTFVGAGHCNEVYGNCSSILGGQLNEITTLNAESVIGGGKYNLISGGGCCAVIGGGYQNQACASSTFVGGGDNNTAKTYRSSIVGGYQSTTEGQYSFIGGGRQHKTIGNYATIIGGLSSLAPAPYGFIGNGSCNHVSGSTGFSTVVNGASNSVEHDHSVIVSGSTNTITSSASFIGSGNRNRIHGHNSGILGGNDNVIMSSVSGSFTVGTGLTATADNTLYVNTICAKGPNDYTPSIIGSGTITVQNGAEVTPPSSRAYGFLSINDACSMVGGNLRLDDSITGGTHDGYSSGTDLRGGAGILFDNVSDDASDGVIKFLRQNDSNNSTWTVKESMIIDQSGNVGIGTSASLTSTLTISGDLSASGSLSASDINITSNLSASSLHASNTIFDTNLVTNETRYVGASGENALIQKNASAGRDELQLYAAGDAYTLNSAGAGIHLYGNSDSEHSGDITFLTGTAGTGQARMIVAGGGGPSFRDETDTHITIGNDGTDIGGETGITNIIDFVDGQHDKSRGMLNLINPNGGPALYIAGASATEGDIAVQAGEALQIGTWDPTQSAGSEFTKRLSISSTGQINFANVATSSAGLVAGDIWNDNGTLKIVS